MKTSYAPETLGDIENITFGFIMDNHNISIKIPKTIIEHLDLINDKCVLVGMCSLNDKLFPSIFLNVTKNDMESAGFSKRKIIDPNINFQYITSDINSAIFAIQLKFNNNYEFILHFNPASKNVHKLMEYIIENRCFGIHYNYLHNDFLVSSFTEIDDYYRDWFKRNITKAKKLRMNKYDYLVLSTAIQNNYANNQNVFHFHDIKKRKVFNISDIALINGNVK